MKRHSAASVILTQKAYRPIEDCVSSAKNGFEVGGVLLGYKVFNRYFVVGATTPSGATEKSQVSFFLDGDWHTARALELMRKFRLRPSILGIWHSHICADDTFSHQDRQSNMLLATAYRGIISMIVMLAMPSNELSMTAYHISPKGKESRCQIAMNDK